MLLSMSPLSQNPTQRAQERTSTRASGHEPFVSKSYTKGLQLPGDNVKMCCVLICQLLLDDGFPLQNRSFRPHFLNRKCRSRDSASIGALRAPRFALRETHQPPRNKGDGGGEEGGNCFARRRADGVPGHPQRAPVLPGMTYAVRGAPLFPPHSDISLPNLTCLHLELWAKISNDR